MQQFLSDIGWDLEFGKIPIPKWVQRVVIDVGLSTNAPQSELCLRQEKATLVFGFEPVSSNIKILIAGESEWPIKLDPKRIGDSFLLLPCALGSKKMVGDKEIHVTKEDAGRSSLLRPINFEIEDRELVKVFTLSDFLEVFPFETISTIDFLKVDVQGLDFEVLKGASNYLRRITVVTVEVDKHDYENTSNNFKLMRLYMFFHGHLYVRRVEIWNKMFSRLGFNIFIDTHDPTFMNLMHVLKFKKKSLRVIQKG
jgi:FkbM family methyltransferase